MTILKLLLNLWHFLSHQLKVITLKDNFKLDFLKFRFGNIFWITIIFIKIFFKIIVFLKKKKKFPTSKLAKGEGI